MNIKDIDMFEEHCTGCGACVGKCSVGAITMMQNCEGFLYPEINVELCTQCGQCLNVCILHNCKSYKNNYEQSVYACQIKNKNILLCATAGGFFQLLAKKVVNIGGIVFGCCYDNEMQPIHVGKNKEEDLISFSGSKYVQSNTTKIFPQILKLINEGKTVLFSGTPCQVDAVNTYCRNVDTSRLITIDVPCYGIPSPGLFSAYIEKLNRQYNGKVIDFRFRDKRTYGWSHTVFIKIQKADGSIFEIEEPDHNKIDYYKMFGVRNCFRKSCYSCRYNIIERVSDFTTGNYWGIENKSVLFETDKGVSMVIINTEKGENIFNEMLDDMIVEKRTIDDAIASNDALVVGSALPKHRDSIYKTFYKKGFDKMFKRYYMPNFRQELKTFIKIILNKRR